MKILLVILSVFLSVCANSQSKDEQAVRQLLNDQSAAWNHCNIESFMKGYWENDSLMFIGKSGITYGWRNTLNNYKKNYPDTAAMGKLTFALISLKQFSSEYFHVIGKWHLQRSIGNLEGHFTLLFKKIKGQWVIIADHSS
jgi:ketosteroid isomerase-like protein